MNWTKLSRTSKVPQELDLARRTRTTTWVQLSGGREPRFLRTLAAACAESGQFSEAVAVARQAAAIATMQGKTDVANRLEKDLVLYRGRLPLRENSLGN